MGPFLSRLRNVIYALKNMWFSKKICFGNLEINGSPNFCEKLSNALDLLNERDQNAFNIVRTNISEVVEGLTTVLAVSPWGVTLTISQGNFNRSTITWVASLLAYQGFRAHLYKENLKNFDGRKIPKESYSGQRVWDLHYESLKSLGASYEEIKHWSDFLGQPYY